MSLHLITGYAGKEHVTSADQGSFNAATLGNGEFALERGRQFEAQIISNNKVRVYDGDLMMQGRHIRLNEKTYEELDFENGSQGMKRTDLIAVRYTKDAVTGIEDAKMVVIKGTPSAGSPQEPALTKGDIINDGVLINEFALYSVSFHDLTIQAPVKLFTTVSTWESMQRQAEEGVEKAIEDFEKKADKTLEDLRNDFDTIVDFVKFQASTKISGNQYIPIGKLKSSGAGSGAVYGVLMDINVYTRLSSGGFGFSSICISMSNTGGKFSVYGNFDRNPQGFDVEAYLSDDGSYYDLYIRTNYGGTKGTISYYTNAPDDMSILVGTPTANQPAGVASGAFSLDAVPYITKAERDKWNGYESKIEAKAEVTTQNFDVYVSPTGNDISGDGSSAKPFQTISRALLEKAQKAGYHKCTVKVAAGDYSAATGLYLDAAIRAQNVYAEIQLQGDVTFASNGEFVMDIDNSTISVTGTDKVINLTGEAASGQIYVHNDGNITMYGPVVKFNGGGAGKGILATSGGIFSQAMGRTSMDNLEDAAEASINGRIYLESVFGGGNTNGFIASSGGQVAYGTSTMTSTNQTVTSKGGRVLTGAQ